MTNKAAGTSEIMDADISDVPEPSIAGKKRTMNDPVRIFVDAEGKEMMRGKKQRVENLNNEDKIIAIKFCINLFINITRAFEIPVAHMYNHLQSAHIFASVYRIHEMMRGKINISERSEISKKREEFTFAIKLAGKDFNLPSKKAIEVWEKTAKEHGYKPNESKEFFGKVGTIMALFNLFNQRIRELRLGPDSWIASKSGEKTSMNSVKSFGINAPYRHFLSGLSWDPSVRATLSKHTTGLCQLLILSKGMSEKYTNRNTIAVERAFSHVANINVIANYVRRHEARENISIINKMAHITHLCGDKHKRRASLCPATIMNYATSAIEIPGTADYSISIIEEKLKNIGFSSKKAALLINNEENIYMPANVDRVKFRQIYFHACNGTHSEDTGILKEITTEAKWLTRSNIGTEFFKNILPQNAMVYVETNPIKFVLYAKNISATQNDHILQAGEVMGNIPIYAGYRLRRITEKQIKYITSNAKSSTISIEHNLPSILSFLDDVIGDIVSEIKKNSLSSKNEEDYIKEGRVQWRRVHDASFEKDVDGTAVEVTPSESGLVFWS